MATTLAVELSEYVPLTSEERRNCTEPIREEDFQENIQRVLLNNFKGSINSSLAELKNMDPHINLAFNNEPNEKNDLKERFADIISKLHEKQVRDDKVAILRRDKNSLLFIHMKDTQGVINSDGKLSQGQRMDDDNIVSFCLLEEHSGEKVVCKVHSNSKTINNLFTDNSSVELSEVGEEVIINAVRKESGLEYQARMRFHEEEFQTAFMDNRIEFGDKFLKIKCNGYTEKYELNRAQYLNKNPTKLDNLHRFCVMDAEYDLLEENKIYKKIREKDFREDKKGLYTHNGSNLYEKSKSRMIKPRFIIFSSKNNLGEVSERFANSIVNSIYQHSIQIYFVNHKLEPNSLIFSNGELSFEFLNSEKNIFSSDQLKLLEYIYKKSTSTTRPTNMKKIYSILFVKLLCAFSINSNGNMPAHYKSLKFILNSSSLVIDTQFLEDNEDDRGLIEYKMGWKIMEDIHPGNLESSNDEPNVDAIVDEISNKVAKSEEGATLLLWGIDENEGIIGLDRNKMEQITGARPKSKTNLDSDYMGYLERHIRQDDSISDADVFKINTEDEPILATLAFRSSDYQTRLSR